MSKFYLSLIRLGCNYHGSHVAKQASIQSAVDKCCCLFLYCLSPHQLCRKTGGHLFVWVPIASSLLLPISICDLPCQTAAGAAPEGRDRFTFIYSDFFSHCSECGATILHFFCTNWKWVSRATSVNLFWCLCIWTERDGTFEKHSKFRTIYQVSSCWICVKSFDIDIFPTKKTSVYK